MLTSDVKYGLRAVDDNRLALCLRGRLFASDPYPFHASGNRLHLARKHRSNPLISPGIYPNMLFTEYQADPCERPSLNASIGKILLDKPPLYAWLAHPKLNPKWRPEDDGHTDEQKKRLRQASAVHKMLLGKGQEIVELDYPDYRTKDARTARDTMLAVGNIPLLPKEHDHVVEIVAGVLSKGPLYDQSKMKPEQVFVWEMDNVLCRAMMDLSSPHEIIDIKTVDSLSDSYLINQIETLKYGFQAYFYMCGMLMLTGELAAFKWEFVEINKPYERRTIALDPSRRDVSMRQVNFATQIWRNCIDRGHWPGYGGRGTETLPYPQWAEAKWLEREIAESE